MGFFVIGIVFLFSLTWYVFQTDGVCYSCGFTIFIIPGVLFVYSDACLPLSWSILAFGLFLRQSGGEVVYVFGVIYFDLIRLLVSGSMSFILAETFSSDENFWKCLPKK